jgi:hypothetical protein
MHIAPLKDPRALVLALIVRIGVIHQRTQIV